MSEHNKRLVRRALEEIYAKGNFELANELVHPDFVDHEPAHPEQPTGPESVKQTARRLQSVFGGLRFEVEDEIAEGDKVVQLVTMSGRHNGPLMGREPTGKEFAVRHAYIWRIADGKIVDLNRIPLPADAPIIDERFDETLRRKLPAGEK